MNRRQGTLRPVETIEEKIERLKEQNIFHNVLYEAYTKRSLAWIDNLFDTLRKNPDKRKKQFVIQEFKKHNVVIHFKNEDYPLYINCFYGHRNGFGDGDIVIVLSTNCFKIFNENNSKNNSYILSLKLELKNCIIHENTHFQQDQYSFKEWQKHYVNPSIGNPDEDDYYNQFEEVDAFARETAFCLKELEISSEEIRNKLKTTEGIKELVKDLSIFNQAGPLVRYLSKRIVYPKSWYRFLREMLKYLEENGSNPNSSKIPDEYSIGD